ncbi:MAG: ABC transporter substrate-binding protein [Actinobacteria bacterium]|nr:ABC transporter substrate-binding protein [Actinomycetota bacterium]
MRIVSLLPSATEMLFAIGVGDRVVGVTHECDFPPAATQRPSVTRDLLPPGLSAAEIDAAVSAGIRDEHTIYALDVDTLRALQPDVVVAQQLCDVCAVPVAAVDAALCALAPHARVVAADPHTLDDLFAAITALGGEVDAAEPATRLVDALRGRLAAVDAAVAGRPRPSVAMLEWPDPPWLPGHWAPDMIERAGGASLFGVSGQPSQRATVGELGAVDADVVVAAFCGFHLAQTVEHVEGIVDRPAWRSLTEGARVVAVDGSAYVSRPGPRLIDGVELLAHVLHGVGEPPAADAVAELRDGAWHRPATPAS